MSKFIPTTKRNGACEVCGDESGKCRRPRPGEIHLCMTYGDARNGQLENGYKCIANFGRGWATFKLDNTQNWTDQQRLDWQEHKARRQQQQHAEAEARRRRSLSAVERDRQYRQLLAELTLHPLDCADLHQRGFTNEEIIRCGFKSVEHYQQLQASYSALLPGIGAGQTLVNYHAGYLCPVRNKDDLIVACQLRLRVLPSGEKNRYRWLASQKRGHILHLFPESGNPEGELPLAVQRPMGEPKGIALAEGTGAKPFLVSQRLNLLVIGAAGGQWATSSATFRETLDSLQAELSGLKIIHLYPDAGDVQNRQVMHRWWRVIALLTKWGWTVQVGWWGQIEKSKKDIDELADTSAIEYISPDEFKRIVEECQRENKPGAQEKPNDWAWENWVKSRRFTPDRKLNQEKFRFGAIPDSGAIIAAKSGLGTGKTEALIELINSTDRAAMIIGYRNNLLFQTINRAASIGLNIYHLREDDGHHLIPDDTINQAFCLDSIHHVDGYFEGRDIYLDETASVLLHGIQGGTLGDKQAKAIRILTRAIKECNNVILLDGNLTDMHVNFIAKLAQNKQVIKLENQRLIPSHNIKFVEGIDVEGEVKKRDKSALIKMLCSDGVVPWIATDSKELSLTLDKLLKDSGKIGFVLNAETAGEEWAKNFLDDPNKFTLERQPQYFVISPTAESGISNTVNGYFTEKFTFLCGVLGTNSQHQIMFRLRDSSIPHYVFCPERSFIRDRSNPNTYVTKAFQQILDDRILQSALLASQSADSPESAMGIIKKALDRSNDDWWDFSCKLGALDNFEQDNLIRCLIHALSEAGHNLEVIQWEEDIETASKIEAAKEIVQREHAQELFVATKFDSVESAKQKAKTNPRKEVQRRIEKTFLLDRIPGIEISEVWTPDFIYERYIKDKEFITRQQRFWLLNNVEISQKRHEVDWYYKATNEDFFRASAKKSSHLTIWALQQLNPLQFLGGEWHKDSPEVIEFVEKARLPEIARAMGMQPGAPRVDGKERIEFLTLVLAMLGLKRKSCGQRLVNGVKTRFYGVNREALKDVDRLAILEAVECKFTLWMESDKSKISWQEQPDDVTQSQVEVNPVVAKSATQPQVEVNPIAAAVATLKTAGEWDAVLVLEQALINEAWQFLAPSEDAKLRQFYQEYRQRQQQQPQAFEQTWGITREQAQRWGAKFQWIKGGIHRVMYAAADYLRLDNGEYVNYSELMPAT